METGPAGTDYRTHPQKRIAEVVVSGLSAADAASVREYVYNSVLLGIVESETSFG